MTKKQIARKYAILSDAEKVERLEHWAKLYTGWLNIQDVEFAFKEDVIVHYEQSLKDLKEDFKE